MMSCLVNRGTKFSVLEFDIPKVTEYLDKEFQKEIAVNSTFQFSQIKLKFGMARVYTNSDKSPEWEDHIDNLLNAKGNDGY